VMIVLPLIAQFFTMYAKESEVRIEPDAFFQLAGSVISFFIPIWFFFTGGMVALFFTPGDLCKILMDNVASWTWFYEIYASFYTLCFVFNSLYLNFSTNWIALFSLISVVYFVYVVARSVWKRRYIKCIGCILMLIFLSYWNEFVRREEALMAYMFFHVADEVMIIFRQNLAPIAPPELAPVKHDDDEFLQ